MTGLILLAAGASTRLGAPKQDLLYQGKTLLQHAIQVALSTNCTPVIVVQGAHALVISPEIPQERVTIVENPEWQEGMASSIRVGVTALEQRAPLATGVILMLCDQPLVDAEHLNNLVQKKLETGKSIVASYYNNTLGVPVLFDQSFFPHLQALKGQEGAKKLLYQYEQEVAAVPFPQGSVDIDTMTDYQQLD
ncbi:nucleotidyltransferase family protein [Chitinophaga japonensis]|uniref:Molybdenum cofactor cytidylyltransferase n=1 Tax=Chitinophaga japonensis TaxID=104662 RepID=A0A562SZE5_CHIJA|nr:nucleotidyltransferase family protein [Chitinophaga japonensis]TWI86657.1 molybdenum cofactor cytidylyltransferase [Chitinophaga japonensis]